MAFASERKPHFPSPERAECEELYALLHTGSVKSLIYAAFR